MIKKINEEVVMEAIRNILSEETKRVRREDYNKVQYKLEELENQLIETVKELRKVEGSIPEGLNTLCGGRVKNISQSLSDAHKNVKQLKEKIKEHKRIRYQSNQIEEKKDK
jgi:DNA-binding HxlR family transcriptional regulator